MARNIRLARVAAIASMIVGGAGALVPCAQAAVIINVSQVGPDVVATGGGSIDLAGLTFDVNQGSAASIIPSQPEVLVGTSPSLDDYSGASSPGAFSSGGLTFANAATGDFIGASGGVIGVPGGYTSGGLLSDTATWNNATFASLGITPGIYVWTWGSPLNGSADSLTLDIGVPEPATLALMGAGLAGIAAARRRRKST